jgi:hypothetical protein
VSILSGEPIVLIGPGSEWFWSMAQFVVVAITFLAIYYQLRLQRHTAAIEQVREISREWTHQSVDCRLSAVTHRSRQR